MQVMKMIFFRKKRPIIMEKHNSSRGFFFLRNNPGNPANASRQNVFGTVRLRKFLLISFRVLEQKKQNSYREKRFFI